MESSAPFASHTHPPFGRPFVSTQDAARTIADHLTTHQREMQRIDQELDAIRGLKESIGSMRKEAYASVRDLTDSARSIESAWASVAVGLAANRHPETQLDAATTELITDVLDQALTNVAMYAAATETNLSVKAEDRWIFVSVFDDGTGGAVVVPDHSLARLQERVNAMHGHFSISSPADRGTLLTIALPVATGDAAMKDDVR